MDHRVTTVDAPFHGGGVADVALDAGVREAGDSVDVAGRPEQAGNLMFFGDERANDDRADEAVSSGHEDFHQSPSYHGNVTDENCKEWK